MRTPEFLAGVTDQGKLQMHADTRRALEIWLLSLAGERVTVTIRKKVNRRSIAQNARYWALLTVAADSLWGDRALKDDLHEEIAHLLLGLPPCPKTGLRRRQRTPKLNTKEFADYTDRVVDKLIELGADLSAWDEETRRMAA